MKRIYEVRRHKITDNMLLAFELGKLDQYIHYVNALIKQTNKEIESYKDNSLLEDLIDNGKKFIEELKQAKQDNKTTVYNKIKEMVNTKNTICTRITRKCVEVVEFDVIGLYGLIPKKDEDNKLYLEIDE